MNFFEWIKNTCLIVAFFVANAAWPMELVKSKQELELFNYPHTSQKFMREFPLMTLKLAQYRYSECDPEVKATIDKEVKAIIDKNIADKKEECFSMVFDMVTKADPDCRLAIMQKMLNQTMADKFLKKTPIRQLNEVLEQYKWAQDVYEGKEAKECMDSMAADYSLGPATIKKKMFDKGYLLEYCHEIKRVDDCFKKRRLNNGNYLLVDRNALVALNILNIKIQEIYKEIGSDQKVELKVPEGRIYYHYYDTYTMENFLNEFKRRKAILAAYLCCAVPIVTSGLSRYIELNYCKKVLTEGGIKWNESVIALNKSLKQLQETWPQARSFQPMRLAEDYSFYTYYSWFDCFKMNSPFFGGGFSALVSTEGYAYYRYKRFTLDFIDSFALAAGSGLVLMALSYLRQDDFPVEFLGVFGGVSAGFLGLACAKTLIHMRTWKGLFITAENISELLKNKSIIIK